eukprot:Hpha_TRINITY_DN10295_c0_g1::TRINITY_DN10295_c0_g1_i1::g.35020::m.35020
MPPSTDTVLREHYWFWWNNTEHTIKPPHKMLSDYLTSVGHASNLILNIAPDPTGKIPAADVVAYKKLGDAIKCIHSAPAGGKVVPTAGPASGGLTNFSLPAGTVQQLPAGGSRNVTFELMEDLKGGQKINEWTLFRGDTSMVQSVSIGHKRIVNVVIPIAEPAIMNGEVFYLVVSSFDVSPSMRSV